MDHVKNSVLSALPSNEGSGEPSLLHTQSMDVDEDSTLARRLHQQGHLKEACA